MESLKAKRYLLVTVHGIRTFGQWQDRLAALVKEKSPEIAVETFGYGYFSVFAFWFPPLRWLAVRAFRRELVRVLSRYPEHMLCIVAHSNGTFLVAKALRQAPELRNKIDTIIFSGSVLRSDFPWSELVPRLGIRRVINDCGISDNILLLSQFLVLFTGMAGRLGFRGMTGTVLINRYFKGGHSLYFEDSEYSSNDFMRKYWLPLIGSADAVPIIDERSKLTTFSGAHIWLIGNADMIKGAAFASLVYATLNYLYLAPRVEAARQFEKRSIEVASSAFTDESFPEIGMRELATALRNARSNGIEPHRQLLSYQLPRFLDIREEASARGTYRIYGGEEFELINTGKAAYRRPPSSPRLAWLRAGGDLIEVSQDAILSYYAEGKYTEPLWTIDIKASWPVFAEIAFGESLPNPAMKTPGTITGGLVLAAFPEHMYLALETEISKDTAVANKKLEGPATLIVLVRLKEKSIHALFFPGKEPFLSEACDAVTLDQVPNMGLSTEQIVRGAIDKNMKQLMGMGFPVVNLKAPISSTLALQWWPLRRLSNFRNSALESLAKCATQDGQDVIPKTQIAGRWLGLRFPHYRQESDLWDKAPVVPSAAATSQVRAFTNEDVALIKQASTALLAKRQGLPREIKPTKTMKIGFPEKVDAATAEMFRQSQFCKRQPTACKPGYVSIPVHDPTPRVLDEHDSAEQLLGMMRIAEARLVNSDQASNDLSVRHSKSRTRASKGTPSSQISDLEKWREAKILVRSDPISYTIIGELPDRNFGQSHFSFCRLQRIENTARCINILSASHREPPIFSADFRFALVRTEIHLSKQVAHLIDLDKLAEIKLPWDLSQYMTAGAFDIAAREFAILDSEGQIGIGRIEDGKLLRKLRLRQSTFRPAGHIFISDSTFSGLALLKDQVVFRAAERSIVALDRTTGSIRWWSRGLGTIVGTHLKIEASETTGTAFVFDNAKGRLISTRTGAWLSGEVVSEVLVKESRHECSASAENGTNITRAWFDENGTLSLQIGRCWFTRQPPVPESTVESFLARIEDLVGPERTKAD